MKQEQPIVNPSELHSRHATALSRTACDKTHQQANQPDLQQYTSNTSFHATLFLATGLRPTNHVHAPFPTAHKAHHSSPCAVPPRHRLLPTLGPAVQPFTVQPFTVQPLTVQPFTAACPRTRGWGARSQRRVQRSAAPRRAAASSVGARWAQGCPPGRPPPAEAGRRWIGMVDDVDLGTGRRHCTLVAARAREPGWRGAPSAPAGRPSKDHCTRPGAARHGQLVCVSVHIVLGYVVMMTRWIRGRGGNGGLPGSANWAEDSACARTYH